MDTSNRTRRQKSFKGCWTCRSRHLKCDEKRPVCLRCTKSRVRCEGYEIRLTWNPINCMNYLGYKDTLSKSELESRKSNVATSSAQHSSLSGHSTLDRDATQCISESSIDSTAEATDKGLDEETTTFTPFVQHLLHSHDEIPKSPPGDFADEAITLFGDINEARMAPFSVSPSPPQELAVSYDSTVTSFAEFQEAIMQSCGTNTGDDHSTFQGSSKRKRMERDEERSYIYQPTIALKSRHLDLLPDPQMQSQVLQNWTFHLCNALIPIAGKYNPFRDIFTPLALEGAGQASGSSTACVALFHFVSSASAWHLALSSDDDEAYTRLARLALLHHNKGIKHLRHNISLQDTSQYVPLIAALTMCIICEGITLATSLWPIHLQGACQWLRTIDSDFWCQSETASIAYQCFAGLVILIECQTIQTISGEDSIIQTPIINFQHPAELYRLDWIYGIPRSSLEHVIAVNKILQSQDERLATTPTAFPTTVTSTHEEGHGDLYLLEIEICMSIPSVTHSLDGNGCDMMKYHASMLFYYATVLYFKRSVMRTPIDEVQMLVESGIEHAEALITYTERPSSPIVWPLAIIAFDTSNTKLQARITKWLNSQTKRTKLDTWACIKNLASNLWRKRATQDGTEVEHESDKELSWQAFLRSPELQIVLI